MKTFFSLLVFTLMINFSLQITSIKFYFEPQERECFYEYFSDSTLVIFEAQSNSTETGFKLIDPDDKEVGAKRNVAEYKEAFTTYSGGYYGLCIFNSARETIAEVSIGIRHGVAAKDYSEVAKAKDLKPIELDLLKLEDKSKELNHYIAYASAHEQIFEGVLEGLSSQISFFSVVIIAVMIVVGLLETVYLRQYFLSRKNI